jgi:hypothetical protein
MTLRRALKLHLRVLEVAGRTLRVVTLRPDAPVRFSTNYFHDTWHILGGADGAAVLGRLLWGLAFQRHPGTLVLIDRGHLVPTPFEADPPDPILLIPDGLTQVSDDALRALKLRLRRAPGPPTTIRWHTFGMPGVIDRGWPRRFWRRSPEDRAMWARERMARRAGFVCYTAPPPILRAHALAIYQAHPSAGGTYFPLAERGANHGWRYDGEFQLIDDFADKVTAAAVARRELFAAAPGPLLAEANRWAVAARADLTLARLRAGRRHRR